MLAAARCTPSKRRHTCDRGSAPPHVRISRPPWQDARATAPRQKEAALQHRLHLTSAVGEVAGGRRALPPRFLVLHRCATARRAWSPRRCRIGQCVLTIIGNTNCGHAQTLSCGHVRRFHFKHTFIMQCCILRCSHASRAQREPVQAGLTHQGLSKREVRLGGAQVCRHVSWV